MFGLIGKFTAKAGARDELITILLENAEVMPGCYSYVVAKDAANADLIWITEVWDSEESHRSSLKLESVRAAIGRAMPLIAGMDTVAKTQPAGGHGLATG